MTIPTTMRAVRFQEYGGADKLEVCTINTPTIKENEILIRIHAVAINDWDWQILCGIPFANRLDFGLKAPKKNRQVLGCDIAGTVVSIGENVRSFSVGDEVFGDISKCWGGFADYAAVPESEVRIKPRSLSFEDAAAIPQAGVLAIQALTEKNTLRDGMNILINGAGGGVGAFAIQLLKQYNCSVTGVDTDEKSSFMTSLGFDTTVDFRKDDITKLNEQYDLIIDNKMTHSPFQFLSILKKQGHYLALGGDTPKLFSIFILRPLLSLLHKKSFQLLVLKPNYKLELLGELCDKGVLTPHIGSKYPLESLPEAMAFYGKGKHVGKIVITMGNTTDQ